MANIYLCTFWNADMSMVLQCTCKDDVLLDGYNLRIKYEQLITFYGTMVYNVWMSWINGLQHVDVID